MWTSSPVHLNRLLKIRWLLKLTDKKCVTFRRRTQKYNIFTLAEVFMVFLYVSFFHDNYLNNELSIWKSFCKKKVNERADRTGSNSMNFLNSTNKLSHQLQTFPSACSRIIRSRYALFLMNLSFMDCAFVDVRQLSRRDHSRCMGNKNLVIFLNHGVSWNFVKFKCWD